MHEFLHLQVQIQHDHSLIHNYLLTSYQFNALTQYQRQPQNSQSIITICNTVQTHNCALLCTENIYSAVLVLFDQCYNMAHENST